jgi:hypothetical protein
MSKERGNWKNRKKIKLRKENEKKQRKLF